MFLLQYFQLGLDETKIRKYVKYQEEREQQEFSLF